MPYDQVAVFAGLGTAAADSPQVHQKALACSRSPAGSLLLSTCFEAFLADLSSLSHDELKYYCIKVDHFHGPDTLLFPSPRYSNNPIISGTRLILLQILTYLAACSDPTTGAFRPSVTDNSISLGFSFGIISASVACTSSSTLEYITNAVAAYRLAFWIGLRAHAARRTLLESAKLSKDNGRPWALVFVGWSAEEALSRVVAYNAQLEVSKAPPLFVTAILDDSSVTISGRCDVLASFAEGLPNTVTAHKTSVDALYHAPTNEHTLAMCVRADVARRDVRYPDFSNLRTSMVCTATGQCLSADSAHQGKLFEYLIDLVLTRPIRWDSVVQGVVDGGTTPSSTLGLVNVGPGLGLVKRMARSLPWDSLNIVDISAMENAAPPAASAQELIAIVGMAVNMPGAPDVSHLWQVLEQGINTLSEIPASRFKISGYHEANTSGTGRNLKARTGNFINDPDGFDARFFRISPREARSMDPQACILLHTAYEALEDAGYVPDATPTYAPETFGCYIGVATGDYVQNLRKDIDVYYSTGNLRAFLSGRISYAFKWSGPSVVVDTACSSSMLSLYQACRALTNRDCNAALAGGVNIITSPDMFVGLDRGHFLSANGQCKAFDASADGYSRGEGCGLFVLKRLSDALVENDNILGVIRGVEINQSGLAHSITHPHAPTQARLLKQLLERSGIDAKRISVVEAHGTGTSAGDPNELESIRGALCVDRKAENPLHITSVKANIGHLEATSGAASLAKLLLMFKNAVIPRQISLRNLNPRIVDLERDHVIINREQVPWRPAWKGETRMALLNNFGASGSNSALLLEEHAVRPVHATDATSTFVFGISAKSTDALIRLRDAYIEWLQRPGQRDTPLANIAYTSTARRIVYDSRIAVTASSKEELIGKLRGSTPVSSHGIFGRVAFVFSGQGSHYRGMGSVLYQTSSLFREIVDECHSLLVESGFPGVIQMLCPERLPVYLSEEEEFAVNQSAIFVLEYALARVWMSWGVQPAVVVGHSLGEYTVHAIAGILSLEDALKLVASRARLMVTRCAIGSTAMLAVSIRRLDLETILASSASFATLYIACYNSPTDIVVSGTRQKLDVLKAYLDEFVHVKNVLLSVPFGYHSSAMDPILSDLRVIGHRLTVHAPRIAVVSNVLGEVVMPGMDGVFTQSYYARHCSEPVQFEQGITSLAQSTSFDGLSTYIEIGPHATTLPMLRAHPLVRKDVTFVSSLRGKQDAWATLSSALAQLYLTSNIIRWRDTFAHVDARCTHLPAYPWSKTKFWVTYEEHDSSTHVHPPSENSAETSFAEPCSVLYRCMKSPNSDGDPTAVFETPIVHLAGAITGHKVGGAALCPASIYQELALAGIRAVTQRSGLVFDDSVVTLRDVEFTKPLVYNPDTRCAVYTTIMSKSDGSGSWRVSSRVGDCPEDVHSRGTFKRQTSPNVAIKFARAAPMVLRQAAVVQAACDAESFSTRTAYDIVFSRVVEYGSEYHTIRSLRLSSDGTEGYAVVQLPDKYDRRSFVIHPIFLDTLLHVAGFAANLQGGTTDAFICHRIEKVTALSHLIDPNARYGMYFRNVWLPGENMMYAETYAIEPEGRCRVVAHIKGIHFRRVLLAGLKRSLAVDEAGHRRPPLRRAERYSTSTSTVNAAGAVVKRVVAETCDNANIDPFTALDAYGVDSLMFIELSHKLRITFPTAQLNADVLRSCTTTAQLVEAVIDRLPGCSQTATPPSTNRATLRIGPGYGADLSDSVRNGNVLASSLGVSAHELADDVNLQSLGLDSLTAIEAVGALRAEFRLNIPRTLFEARTTVKDALSKITHASNNLVGTSQLTLTPPHTPPARDTLEPKPIASPTHARLTETLNLSKRPVPLQAGVGTPLVLIHDGSGLVKYLLRLAPLGRALWGLNNPHFLDGTPWDSLETMAGVYAKDVLATIKGNGPVLLGGWSFEAARHLRALGALVRGVVLIDSPAPQYHVPFDDTLIAAIVTSRGRSSANELTRLVSRQFQKNSRLLGAYGAKRLQGPFEEHVVLLRSSEGFRSAKCEVLVPDWLADRANSRIDVEDWERMLGRSIKVFPIPGNHFEVFSPQNIPEVSEAIIAAANYLDEQS